MARITGCASGATSREFDSSRGPRSAVYAGAGQILFTWFIAVSNRCRIPSNGAQALADGKLGADGVFHATKIQAKCASKYEAKPIQDFDPQHLRLAKEFMENIGALASLLAFCFAVYAILASVWKWASARS